MNKPRYIYLVFNRGIVDFIACTLKNAQEMAEPPCSDIDPNIFMIHRWVLKNGKYQFDRRVKKKDEKNVKTISRKRRKKIRLHK